MSVRNRRLWHCGSIFINGFRFYNTNSNPGVGFNKLRPMILNRVEDRAEDYPVKSTVLVAREVLQARNTLYDGVSTLINHIPTWACKYCTEVHIGEEGHLIKTCPGSGHYAKNKLHSWAKGSINDVLVPVETFHLPKMFQNVVKHQEKVDRNRIPAVIELCLQAGADSTDQSLSSTVITPSEPLSDDNLRVLATKTLKAWETLRFGVQKLLLVYPARVCKNCSELHVGISGHKARLRGVFKYESSHLWEKATVDDLVPTKIVWYKRRQDLATLVDKGRGYYGRAPVVVDLCSKGGAIVPSKYFCMMKMDGLSAPV